MKQMLAMMRLDRALIFRNKVAVYIVIVPIVMAFVIMAALTAAENDNLRITVAGNVPSEIMERIGLTMDIERVEDTEKLIKRVNEFDNIPGAYWDGDALRVLFQGNEGAAYEEKVRDAVNAALNMVIQPFAMRNVSTGRDFLTQMIIAVLLTSPTAIGGVISGFNIITDKEAAVSRAYRVAPLSAYKYFGSRLIVSVAVGLINLVGVSLILGAGAKLPAILLASLFALPQFALSLVLAGGIAKDKMGCLSMIKVIMLAFLCLPIGAAVTPEAYRFFFYPFPMYWHYKSMESALQGSFNYFYGIMTLVVSGAVFTLCASLFGKKVLE